MEGDEGELDCGEEGGVELVVAGCDFAVVLEVSEEAFDLVASLVVVPGVVRLRLGVRPVLRSPRAWAASRTLAPS